MYYYRLHFIDYLNILKIIFLEFNHEKGYKPNILVYNGPPEKQSCRV